MAWFDRRITLQSMLAADQDDVAARRDAPFAQCFMKLIVLEPAGVLAPHIHRLRAAGGGGRGCSAATSIAADGRQVELIGR